MTDAERMIAGFGGTMRPQALAIAENIVAMEQAMNLCRDDIAQQPPYIVEHVGEKNPHPVRRENKAWVGFNNLAKAHANLIKELGEIIGAVDADDDGSDPLAELIGMANGSA